MVNHAIHESIQWTIDTTPSGENSPTSDTIHPLHDSPVEDIRTLPTLHALLSPYPKTMYGERNRSEREEMDNVRDDIGDTMNVTSNPTTTNTQTSTTTTIASTTSTTSTAASTDTMDTTAAGGVATPSLTLPSRSPLVYIHIYNPLRTYLKQFLQQHFHISFGDEERDRTCVLTPPVLYYDYIAPYSGGDQLIHCRAVGLEYFVFRVSEVMVRWLFEKIMSQDVRKYLLDKGMVELTMAEE